MAGESQTIRPFFFNEKSIIFAVKITIMKKIAYFLCLIMLVASCQQKQKQQTQTETEPVNTAPKLETTILDGVYHFTFQGFELWTLQDMQRKMPASLFPNAKKSDLEKCMPNGEAESAINTFLIKKNGKYVLFDSGLGVENGGVMIDKLTLLHVNPEDIYAVCLTHCHPDHIGGMVSKGKAFFPNALVYCSGKELEAFKDDALTQEMVKVYGSRLHQFIAGEVLLDGIRTIDAPGHTPGHTFFQIDNLLIVGDLIHAAALQIPHPEYCAKYDVDKTLAAKTRKNAYQYINQNKLVVAGMHLPYSGVILNFEKEQQQ